MSWWPYSTGRTQLCLMPFLTAKYSLQVVEQEADELVAKYGTPRRTAIVADGARWVCRCRWRGCMPNVHCYLLSSLDCRRMACPCKPLPRPLLSMEI